jgi:predicted acetyltransferase
MATDWATEKSFNLYYRRKILKFYEKHGYVYNKETDNFQFTDGMTIKKACKILGIKKGKFKRVTKEELKKLYIQKAKQCHPDAGGNTKDFQDLKIAFEFANAI